MANSLAPKTNAISAMNPAAIAKTPAMVRRFEEVIGKAAPAFLAGIVAATQANSVLSDPQATDQPSLFAAGLTGATLNLSFVPSLGQASLVPFREKGGRNKVQFQLMTRGMIQLAQRSGQYRNINTGKVYSDEYDGEDLLTGEVRFHRVDGGYRDQGNDSEVIGYFAYIETVTGFRKTVYWTKTDIINHAKKFSKSWSKRDQAFIPYTPWADHFDAMAEKTVLKYLLNHYGPMSVDSVLAEALRKDQQVFDSEGNGSYEDNATTDEQEAPQNVEEAHVSEPAPAAQDEPPVDAYEDL